MGACETEEAPRHATLFFVAPKTALFDWLLPTANKLPQSEQTYFPYSAHGETVLLKPLKFDPALCSRVIPLCCKSSYSAARKGPGTEEDVALSTPTGRTARAY